MSPFRKDVIGLLGIHIMERCREFGNWSDAYEVLAELLNKNINFHQLVSQENSTVNIVETAVCICVEVKKYDVIAALVRRFDFFRVPSTHTKNLMKLIKEKYLCLNVVIVAIVKELAETKGQIIGNDKLALCKIGISILTQILTDWEEDVAKHPEAAELVQLASTFEFLIHGCMVLNSPDDVILLSQLQECHPQYLEWKTDTLRMVILFFLRVGRMQVFLSDELPLNLIEIATERKLIPKLPEYTPFKSNVLVVWPSLSDLEMRLVILMYLKSILLRVYDLSVTSVDFGIEMIDIDSHGHIASSHQESMSSLQRLLTRDMSPSLLWSRLSQKRLRIDRCSVSIIRKILSNASVDLKPERSSPPSLLQLKVEPVGIGDVDWRQPSLDMQLSYADSRAGFSNLPTAHLRESDETVKSPVHLPSPQNRAGDVRNANTSKYKRNIAGFVSSALVRSTGAEMVGKNPISKPAMKLHKLDSSVSSMHEIARKHFNSPVCGPSTRKVLLKTPQSATESPQLLQPDASVVRMGLNSNPAVGALLQTPSNHLVRSVDPLSDSFQDRRTPSSRRRGASFSKEHSAGVSSADSGPKLPQPDLRQHIMSKKVSPHLVKPPPTADRPVQNLLDIDLRLRPPPHHHFK